MFSRAMKVVVLNVVTGEYMVDATRWTSQAGQARVFESVAVAIQFCRDMENVCAVLKDDQASTDLVLPIGRRLRKNAGAQSIS
jgi:hypothetical protein